MKRILLTAVFAICVLYGCTPKADKACATASDFLTAFFAMDFDQAACLCNDNIAAMIRDTIAASDYPNEEIRAKVVEASKKTTFKITSAQQIEETGEVEVKYDVFPFGAPKGVAISRTMRLDREDGDWKIVALE